MSKRSRLHRLMQWGLPVLYFGLRTEQSFWVRVFPELANFDSTEGRFIAFGNARRGLWPWNILLFAVWMIFFTATIPWQDAVAALLANITSFKISPVLLTLFVILPPAWLKPWVFRSRIRRALRKQLSDLGHPICVPCGYDLTGNVSGRCPECGTPIPDKIMEKQTTNPPKQP